MENYDPQWMAKWDEHMTNPSGNTMVRFDNDVGRIEDIARAIVEQRGVGVELREDLIRALRKFVNDWEKSTVYSI